MSNRVKDEIEFSSDEWYEKFDYQVFPTIRREEKYGPEGHVLEVYHGPDKEWLGRVEVVATETKTIRDMTTSFLMHDTNEHSWASCIESLNSFWDEPIGLEEQLVIYWLKWLGRVDRQ